MPDQDMHTPMEPGEANGGDDVMRRAAVAKAEADIWLQRQQEERERLQVELTEATLQIESSNRRATQLQLDNVELRNNMQTMASTIEDLRQEVSDYRAVFSSFKAQLEHLDIPLPVRKRVKKNGDSKESIDENKNRSSGPQGSIVDQTRSGGLSDTSVG